MKSKFSKISAIALCVIAAFFLTGCGEMPTAEGSIVSEVDGLFSKKFFVIQDGEKVQMDCEFGFIRNTCSLDGIVLTYGKTKHSKFYLAKVETTDGTKYSCGSFPPSCTIVKEDN